MAPRRFELPRPTGTGAAVSAFGLAPVNEPPVAGRRLTDRGAARRRQIIECGVRLVAERGALRVRVVDIARELGVQSSLFYWYFRDLDDLLTQAITDARRYVRHVIAESIAPVDDPLAKVYIASYEPVRLAQFNEAERVMTLGDVEASLRPNYANELRKSIDGFIAEMTDILIAGRELGAIRADMDARHLATSVHSVVHHNIVLYYRGMQSGDVTELAEAIASFAVRGVCADAKHAAAVERTWAQHLGDPRRSTSHERAPSQTVPPLDRGGSSLSL